MNNIHFQNINRPMGVMFHHFHDKKIKKTGQGSIAPKQFEKIIKYLLLNFNVLNPKEWLEKIFLNSLEDNDVCITFDDSLYCQYKIGLKVLKKYNLKAFWFVYSSVFNGELNNFEIYRKFRVCYFNNFDEFYYQFINLCKEFKYKKFRKKYFEKEIKIFKLLFPFYSNNDIMFRIIRNNVLNKNEFEQTMNKMIKLKNTSFKRISKKLWMNNNHLNNLYKSGHEIGMHAYDHPYDLKKLSYDEQYKQLKANFDHIKSITNKKPISIAYPNGSYNQNTIKILQKLGVKVGFCSNMKFVRINKRLRNYLIPRNDYSQLL